MSEPKQDNKNVAPKKPRRTMIGGQALIEGIMMRGKSSVAMAVRAPNGEIELCTERIEPRGAVGKIPIVRGVVAFVSSMTIGIKSLLKSAEISSPEEEMPSKGTTSLAAVLGIALAVGLFIGIPFFIKWSIARFARFDDVMLLSVIEGGSRLAIFVLYLAFVRLVPDIKRTFMYHGAEHRTINCFERGLPLTVENVQSCSIKHNRCGTTFIFFVIIFAIVMYAIINRVFTLFPQYDYLFGNFFFAFAVRLMLLPLIAGLSFELLRALALLPDNKFTNAVRAPGLALQMLSTAVPDDDMAAVAIMAFTAVLELDGQPNKPTIDFYEREFALERKALAQKLSDNPQDADWIFCAILGKARGELGGVDKITREQTTTANEYADRLLAGEPLDYVLGTSEFCGVKLKVDSRVLLPRFETEVLANLAVKHIGDRALRVLDLCTGSGCIAAVLAQKTGAAIVASDVSSAALEQARENLAGASVEVVQSDMFENISGTFDLIVSNPPYVRTSDIDGLQLEVRKQPRIALDGGVDGLGFYRIIADCAAKHLAPNGTIMVEVGYDQAGTVAELFSKLGSCRIEKDLDGVDRIVVCDATASRREQNV